MVTREDFCCLSELAWNDPLSNLRHLFWVEAAFVVDIDGNIVLHCMLSCWILKQTVLNKEEGKLYYIGCPH